MAGGDTTATVVVMSANVAIAASGGNRRIPTFEAETAPDHSGIVTSTNRCSSVSDSCQPR